MIEITINGVARRLDVDPDMPLLWAIRDHAGLTGTKFGCGIAQCGACTVHLDGVPTRACVTRVGDVGAQAVTTIEGTEGAVAEAVRAAWRGIDVVQCGYCQSGQIMAAIGLLSQTKSPSDDEIAAAMEGNLCRCGTYQRIRTAIRDVALALG